jgi:hypothetical protein
MKLFRTLAIAVLAMVSGASAQAGVVALSNMGELGTGNYQTGDTADQTASQRTAVGFRTGADSFQLQKIAGVFFGISSGTVNVVMSIYEDNGGSAGSAGIPGTLVASSVSTPVGSGPSVYNFSFTGQPGSLLSANTNYFAMFSTVSGALSWYSADTNGGPGGGYITDPIPYNASGFMYNGAKRTTDSFASFSPQGSDRLIAIFGTTGTAAVPEPALTSLLCLGGVALIRRRMKK